MIYKIRRNPGKKSFRIRKDSNVSTKKVEKITDPILKKIQELGIIESHDHDSGVVRLTQLRDELTKLIRKGGNTGSGKSRIMITKDGVQISRTDYIRQEIKKGRTRGSISRELGVIYQIVFQSSKGMVFTRSRKND